MLWLDDEAGRPPSHGALVVWLCMMLVAVVVIVAVGVPIVGVRWCWKRAKGAWNALAARFQP